MRNRIPLAVVVALLLGAMFFLQIGVLEKSEVQRLERASQNLGELRASTLLPTYIGSLFLGSFRAVAIDILWIQMQRMREQEHRYFETVEYMELITKLQPRNPEAWAYMAWDSGYNIANQFRTAEDEQEIRHLDERIKAGDPQAEAMKARRQKLIDGLPEKDRKYRAWVKRGLKTLIEACRHMPDDPYLHHDIGQTLWTKSAWSNGILEMQFIRAIEEDGELQAILADGLPAGRRSPFELAEIWFKKGQDKLEGLIQTGRFRLFRTLMESMSRAPDEDRRHHTTQMGRNIDMAAFVGAIHEMRFLDGILKWNRARDAAPDRARELLREASRSFERAAEQARIYRLEHSPIAAGKRAFHDARADLCRGMSGFCAEQAKMTHPLSEADRRKLLDALEPIRWNPVDRLAAPMDQIPPPDERYLLDYMGGLKRSLGGDAWEYNDDFYTLHRGNLLSAGEGADATIGPDPTDVDYYHFYASAAAGSPITSLFRIKAPEDATLTVVTLSFNDKQLMAASPLRISPGEEREFPVVSDAEGSVFVIVKGAGPEGSRRAYRLMAMGVRR